MPLQDNLRQYLKQTLGTAVVVHTLDSGEVKGFPHHVLADWEIARVSIGRAAVVILLPKREAAFAVRRFEADLRLVAAKLGENAAICFRSLTSYQRTRLITSQIPFVAPGHLYLPMLLIDLPLRWQKPVASSAEMGWPAQLTCLRHLLWGDVAGQPLHRLASKLAYSAMTMSTVCDELCAAGLADAEIAGRTRRIVFRDGREALWRRAHSMLRSPVRRLYAVESPPARLLKSGVSALAVYTDLEPPGIPTFAVYTRALKQQEKDLGILPVEAIRDGSAMIEEWNYDPRCLGAGEAVDPLSLHLALRDESDERILIGIDEMMEAITWLPD